MLGLGVIGIVVLIIVILVLISCSNYYCDRITVSDFLH